MAGESPCGCGPDLLLPHCGTVGPTPPPGCRDEGLLAQSVRGAVRTDGVANHPSEGDVVVRRSGIKLC